MSRTNEPFVNTELLELVREAKLNELGPVDVEARDKEQANHLSELYRIVMNYDEDEMMVCAAAMLEKDDSVYPRVQIAERNSLKKKGKKGNE